jgi:HAD superfamily hydrolase (TIGR01509 family)
MSHASDETSNPSRSRETVLLFDIMSTVVYDPFYEHMPDYFEMSFEELLEAKDPDAWFEFERGEIDETTLAERFFDERDPIDLEGIKRRFYDEYRFVEGMEGLLAELNARGVEIHAFSNYGPWYRMIEDKLELSRFLAWSFVSCCMGLRKPDPEVYDHVVEALGVEPETCLFVDDRESNVEGAREAGLRSFVFDGAEPTRLELARRLGIEELAET